MIIKFLGIKKTIMVAMLLILFSTLVLELKAEKVTKIIATINDSKIISSYDLEQYKQIYKYLAPNETPTKEEIIQREINTILLNQEAVNFGVQATDEQIQFYFEGLEKKGVSVTKLKQDKNIDEGFLLEYIKSSIIKETFIQYLVSNNVVITDDELKREVSKISSLNGVPLFLLSEILITNNSDDSAETYNKINNIYTKLNNNNFTSIAEKYSESISATEGGNIGWVPATQLTSEQLEQIVATKKGSITQPIKVQNGYVILLVKDQKTEISYNPGDASVARYIQNSARQNIYMQKAELYIQDYVKTLRDKATIEIK